MRTPRDTITLHDYLRVLRARRWTIVATTVLAVAIAGLYAAVRSPSYDATASIEFQTRYISLFAPGVQLPPDVTPSQTAAANSRLVARPEVVTAAKTALATRVSAAQLAADVSTTIQPDSNLVEITASTGNAAFSARVANAFAVATRIFAATNDRGLYANESAELSAALSKGGLDRIAKKAYRTAIGRLDVLSRVADPVLIVLPATAPAQPSAPQPARDIVLAVILGVIAGIGAAFLLNALGGALLDRRQVEEELRLPLVGEIPAAQGVKGARAGAAELEPFRTLRTRVRHLVGEDRLRAVVVASPLGASSTTQVAAGYARACAAAGERTILVQCDSGRPSLRQGAAGTGESGLLVIPAADERVAVAIGSERFPAFLDALQAECDVVVFDAAPLPASSTLQIAAAADAVLFCVRLGATKRAEALAARDALGWLSDTPAGVVVAAPRPAGRSWLRVQALTRKLPSVARTR